MKRFLYLYLIFSMMSCNKTPPDSFRLEGYAEGIKDSENIILYYESLQNGEWYKIADTTKIINGKFSFKGKIDELTVAELCFEEPEEVVISAQLFLEPTKMKLRIDKNKPYAYKLLGTKVEKEYVKLRKELEYYDKAFHENLLHIVDILSQIQLNNDNIAVRDSLISNHQTTAKAISTNRRKAREITHYFVLKNITYKIVPGLLSNFWPIDTVKSIYSNLPEQSKASLMGKYVCKRIKFEENKKNSSVGCFAPDFIRNDVSGNIIRLSSYKNNNFVLLAFWGSWCSPCIEAIIGENPKLKNLYDKHKEKGLAIIGISLDEDINRWLSAINDYKLNQWPQVLAVEEENKYVFNYDDLSNLYNVKGVPYYIFIDKQVKIISRWDSLDEEQLIEVDRIIKDELF